jgi:hypothetical protein
LLSFFYLFSVKFYRIFLSAHFGGACRFYPTCSCYAEEVLLSHPPARAVVLILKRLSKCHFFGSFGVDFPPTLSYEAGKRSIKPSA